MSQILLVLLFSGGLVLICFVVWVYRVVRILIKMDELFSRDVYRWRSYTEIQSYTHSSDILLGVLLEAMIEDGDLLYRPIESMTVTDDGEPLPPEVINVIEDAIAVLGFDKYEYRRNPQRPRRGGGMASLKGLKQILLVGHAIGPKTA